MWDNEKETRKKNLKEGECVKRLRLYIIEDSTIVEERRLED